MCKYAVQTDQRAAQARELKDILVLEARLGGCRDDDDDDVVPKLMAFGIQPAMKKASQTKYDKNGPWQSRTLCLQNKRRQVKCLFLLMPTEYDTSK